jgi:hypothetical protein
MHIIVDARIEGRMVVLYKIILGRKCKEDDYKMAEEDTSKVFGRIISIGAIVVSTLEAFPMIIKDQTRLDQISRTYIHRYGLNLVIRSMPGLPYDHDSSAEDFRNISPGRIFQIPGWEYIQNPKAHSQQ